MNEFWTDKKIGKHPNIAQQAELLYEHYAMCSSDKLLARLKESKFNFGNYGPCAWKDFLTAANLDDCLKPEYVPAALKVTTTQPAIGKGEFLFVSVFDNVGFAKQSGDLIDITTNAKVEVKGINSTIGNGNNSKFKTLNQDKINHAFGMFGVTAPNVIDAPACTRLKELIGTNGTYMYNVLDILRNTNLSYREIVEDAVEFYKSNKKLLLTIAAMHLYSYLKLSNVKYLLAVNNDKYMCFIAPHNIHEAAKILARFEIHGWTIGKSGVSVSLK